MQKRVSEMIEQSGSRRDRVKVPTPSTPYGGSVHTQVGDFGWGFFRGQGVQME